MLANLPAQAETLYTVKANKPRRGYEEKFLAFVDQYEEIFKVLDNMKDEEKGKFKERMNEEFEDI